MERDKYSHGRRCVIALMTESVCAGHLQDKLSSIDGDMPAI